MSKNWNVWPMNCTNNKTETTTKTYETYDQREREMNVDVPPIKEMKNELFSILK